MTTGTGRAAARASLAAAVLLAGQASRARAQEAASPGTAAPAATTRTPPTLTAPSTRTVPAPVPVVTPPPGNALEAELAKFDRFDALQPQGQTTNFPGTYDTLLGDVGGWRSALYDDGLYFRVVSTNSGIDNVLPETGSRQPQQYAGQKLTLSENTFFQFAWKFAGTGKDISQVNISYEDDGTSWETFGPSKSNFLRLDVYNTFFDRRVEVDAGFSGEIEAFIGIFAGGDPILASGLSGSVPVEVGLSAGTADTPFVNVTLNGDDGWYSKTGIQRSTSPRGQVYDAQHNGVGLDFDEPGANPLYIEEVGVLRPASPDGRQIWLRAGGVYNTTEYARFDGNGTTRNWMLYALGDYQLFKPSRDEPYRGVFGGFSAEISPVAVNAYSRTFEGRAYQIGLVPGRPTDATTFTVDFNNFSNIGRDTLVEEGVPAQRYQVSASLLYAMHVTRGLYVSPSITFLHNPSFVGDYGDALNLAVNLTVLL